MQIVDFDRYKIFFMEIVETVCFKRNIYIRDSCIFISKEVSANFGSLKAHLYKLPLNKLNFNML